MKEHKILRNMTFLKFLIGVTNRSQRLAQLEGAENVSHYSRYKKGKLASPEKEGTSSTT